MDLNATVLPLFNNSNLTIPTIDPTRPETTKNVYIYTTNESEIYFTAAGYDVIFYLLVTLIIISYVIVFIDFCIAINKRSRYDSNGQIKCICFKPYGCCFYLCFIIGTLTLLSNVIFLTYRYDNDLCEFDPNAICEKMCHDSDSCKGNRGKCTDYPCTKYGKECSDDCHKIYNDKNVQRLAFVIIVALLLIFLFGLCKNSCTTHDDTLWEGYIHPVIDDYKVKQRKKQEHKKYIKAKQNLNNKQGLETELERTIK
eukprot:135748_1